MHCPLCKFPANNEKALYVHLDYQHGKSATNLMCINGCGRFYDNMKSFKSHISTCSTPVETSENVILNEVEGEVSPDASNSMFDESVPCTSSSDDFVSYDSQNLKTLITSKVDIFVAKLYGKPKLPRNYIQSIIEDVSTLIKDCFYSQFKTDLLSILVKAGKPKEVEHVISMLNQLENPFEHLSSEYKRLNYFENNGALVRPKTIEIGTRNIWKTTANGTLQFTQKCTIQSIPLNLSLKNFLELPDAYESIQNEISSLRVDANHVTIKNFMQCPLWKQKRARFSVNDIVFPLHIFCDGVECNNPLGSHNRVLDAVYASLPCLPPECQSLIENIFLVYLYEYSLRKDFTDKEIFAHLISMLKSLEDEGILVQTNDGEKRIYFVTCLLLADNKAMNSLGGFVEGFTANYFCRFCKAFIEDTRTQAIEMPNLLRDEISYAEDVAACAPILTGVKSDCFLNALPSFHITSNYSVDIFHDLAEGCCHYVVVHVLKHCIPKFFTLETLNDRISSFHFGPCESNTIPLINDNRLNEGCIKLRMSGSETMMFVKYLGLLVGDLIPENDDYWLLFLKLRQVIDICFSKCITASTSTSLRILVEEFNTMYVSVTKDTLKAKMHNLVHYSRVLEMSGPLSLLSCAKFESKHRSLTVPAHATTSRVNISYTLALRHQLVQSFRFISKESILPKLQYGHGDIVDLTSYENYVSFRKSIPPSCKNQTLFSPNWIVHKGTTYKPGMALLVNVNEHGPVFAKLQSILLQDSDILFLFEYYLNLGFNEHILAYAVGSSGIWSCKRPNELYDPLPLFAHHDITGDSYITLRHAL